MLDIKTFKEVLQSLDACETLTFLKKFVSAGHFERGSGCEADEAPGVRAHRLNFT